ncbi:MAG: hypothetical protein SPG00_06310, partial [Holdemanella porci]|nr:hypothetical protein [Holdemanella porci]
FVLHAGSINKSKGLFGYKLTHVIKGSRELFLTKSQQCFQEPLSLLSLVYYSVCLQNKRLEVKFKQPLVNMFI